MLTWSSSRNSPALPWLASLGWLLHQWRMGEVARSAPQAIIHTPTDAYICCPSMFDDCCVQSMASWTNLLCSEQPAGPRSGGWDWTTARANLCEGSAKGELGVTEGAEKESKGSREWHCQDQTSSESQKRDEGIVHPNGVSDSRPIRPVSSSLSRADCLLTAVTV